MHVFAHSLTVCERSPSNFSHISTVSCKYSDYSSSVSHKGFLIHKYYSPCIPGDRRETEENMDDGRRSNQRERRREERDGLLSGWWQRDRGAEGWHHPRWEHYLKLGHLMLALSLNNTLKKASFSSTGFRYGSDIVPFSKVDQDQMKYKHDGKCFAVLGFAKQNTVLYL